MRNSPSPEHLGTEMGIWAGADQELCHTDKHYLDLAYPVNQACICDGKINVPIPR